MPDPKHKDAFKRIRQNEKARIRNRIHRGNMRSQIKKLRELVDAGDAKAAKTQLPLTISAIQKVSQKGIVHRKQAARRVSRLNRAVNALG